MKESPKTLRQRAQELREKAKAITGPRVNNAPSQQDAPPKPPEAPPLPKTPTISPAQQMRQMSATLENVMRNTAEKARFGKELVEACARLKDKIDIQVVTLMNMMNRSLDIGTDGRAYTNDIATDKIVPNATNPDLISSFRNTEAVTRELAAIVKDMPQEIETLFHILDEAHDEFISIVNGEKYQSPKREFAPVPSIESAPRAARAARPSTSVDASLQRALSESADRAAFLQVLVEASARLKEKVDTRVVTLLTLMNDALSRGVDDVAYGYDAANNRMTALPQPDLVIGFTTTEKAALELQEAVVDLPSNIQALLKELMEADEEFNAIITQHLTK